MSRVWFASYAGLNICDLQDDEHDSEGDEEDDEDDDDGDDDEDDDMSEEDSEPFSDSEGSEGEDEDAEVNFIIASSLMYCKKCLYFLAGCAFNAFQLTCPSFLAVCQIKNVPPFPSCIITCVLFSDETLCTLSIGPSQPL